MCLMHKDKAAETHNRQPRIFIREKGDLRAAHSFFHSSLNELMYSEQNTKPGGTKTDASCKQVEVGWRSLYLQSHLI